MFVHLSASLTMEILRGRSYKIETDENPAVFANVHSALFCVVWFGGGTVVTTVRWCCSEILKEHLNMNAVLQNYIYPNYIYPNYIASLFLTPVDRR